MLTSKTILVQTSVSPNKTSTLTITSNLGCCANHSNHVIVMAATRGKSDKILWLRHPDLSYSKEASAAIFVTVFCCLQSINHQHP